MKRRCAEVRPGLMGHAEPAVGKTRAFSLVEILVAVALLAIIVLGLLAMLNQTQKAFQAGMTQVDVLESGRVATEMIARQLAQMAPSDISTNFRATITPPSLTQVLPGGGNPSRTNVIEELYFLTRMNQQWQAYGYRVNATNGVGTLYQFYGTTNVVNSDPGALDTLFNSFIFSSFDNLHRLVDGVVDFQIHAYDANGRLISYNNAYNRNNDLNYSNFTATVTSNLVNWVGMDNTSESPPNYYYFTSNAVPAYVEFELGVLEQRTLARFQSMPYAAQTNFLARQPGAVHLFRQRVAIRTVDRSIYQ